MARAPIERKELVGATLRLGGKPVDLTDYATTGLRVLAVAPTGMGKTNTGLLIAEQLAQQGWVSVLVDPEDELESLYGKAVPDALTLRARLRDRAQPIVVVRAKDASDFLPYGRVLLEAADEERKPIFLMIDEGQVFSAGKGRKNDIGEASDLINDFTQRGRKRALDLYVTAFRFVGSIHRTIFTNANLTLVGSQQDPASWPSLAARFRGTGIGYAELAALGPGEFFCFTRPGVEKIRVPLAAALAKVAPPARAVKPTLPSTFTQWDRAISTMPLERLQALTAPAVNLLGTIAGLTPQQMLAGARALQDELEIRAG